MIGTSCFPDSIVTNCDSVPDLDTMIITLLDYPGCTFTIVYEMYTCRNGPYSYYHLGDFQLISYTCPAFTTALNNAIAAGTSTLTALMENFEYDVASKIKTNLINEAVTVGTYPCGSGAYIITSYIKSSCYYRCYIQHPNQTVSFTNESCGTDCCAQRQVACRNQAGELVITTYNLTNGGAPCQDPPRIEDNSIPKRCSYESACTFTCPE